MYNRLGAAGSYGHLWDKVQIGDITLFTFPVSQVSVSFQCVFLHRQKPYVIRSPRRRLAVEVQLQNRLENAYNTSLTLHYSRNLHFSSLSIRVEKHSVLTHAMPHTLTNIYLR